MIRPRSDTKTKGGDKRIRKEKRRSDNGNEEERKETNPSRDPCKTSMKESIYSEAAYKL